MSTSPVFWLETQYSSSNTCKGLPTSFKIFSTADPTETFHPAGEKWPGIYSMVMNLGGTPQYPYYFCGQLSVSPQGACCTSSLDTSLAGSAGVESALDLPLSNYSGNSINEFYNIITSNAPSTIPPTSYILLSSADSSSLFGFPSVAYLPDGTCIDSSTNPVRAFANGTVAFYNDSACAIPVEFIFTSSVSATFFTTTTAGNISAQKLDIRANGASIGWIAYQPNLFLVPNFKEAPEIIGHGVFLLAIILHIACSALAGWKYYHRRNTQMLLQFVSQVAWVVKIITTVSFLDTVFYTLQGLFIGVLFYLYTFNLASLLTTIYTSYSFEILLNPPLHIRIIAYTVLILAHLGFAGGCYTQPVAQLLQVNNPESVSQDTVNFLSTWSIVWFPYWIMIWFIWNIVPMLGVAYVIASRKNAKTESNWNICKRIAMHDRGKIMLLLLGHTLALLIYYITLFLQTRTTLLRDDRTFISLRSVSELGIGLHCILNFFLVESVTDFLADTVGRSRTKIKSSNSKSKAKSQQPSMENQRLPREDEMIIDVVSKPVLSDLKFSFLQSQSTPQA